MAKEGRWGEFKFISIRWFRAILWSAARLRTSTALAQHARALHCVGFSCESGGLGAEIDALVPSIMVEPKCSLDGPCGPYLPARVPLKGRFQLDLAGHADRDHHAFLRTARNFGKVFARFIKVETVATGVGCTVVPIEVDAVHEASNFRAGAEGDLSEFLPEPSRPRMAKN